MLKQDGSTGGIDWSPFDKYPESTCECSCGKVYRSHAKFVASAGLITRRPCPGCGETNRVRAARGDPELMTLKGD